MDPITPKPAALRSIARRAAFVSILLLPFVVAGAAVAGPSLRSIDVRATSPAHSPRALTREETRLVRSGTSIRYDERLGIPTFVWTAPSGSAERSERKARAASAEDEARRHLARVASLYDLADADVAAARVAGVHDTGSGGIIVKFREEVGGVDVFGEEASVLMTRDLDRVAVSGFLGGAHSRAAAVPAPKLSAEEAVAVALRDRSGDTGITKGEIAATATGPGPYRQFELRGGSPRRNRPALPHPARSKPVLFHAADGYRSSFYVEISAEVSAAGGVIDNDVYAYVVAGDDGEILFRHDLTVRDTFDYRVWAETSGEKAPLDSPYGGSVTPHPTGTPDGYTPPFVAPSLVNAGSGPVSTNDPWLASGAMETVGNNVDAYADAVPPDGFSSGDSRASITSPGVFDYTYDPTVEPAANTTQASAAITSAFYITNFLHDIFYDEGFDEASGNAQADNYGRGGVAGDRMNVEAQDYSGTDNADMSTPADGGSPRMQLYLWAGPSAARIDVNSQPGLPVLPSQITTLALAAFGASSFSTTGDIVAVDDGSGVATDGCEAPFVNAAAVAGKIALIDRGTCTFVQKTENAVAAGAIGVLIANNTGGTTVIGMSGSCSGPCDVGVMMVSQNQGADIAAAIASGTVNVTMTRIAAVQRDVALDGQTVSHEWGHYLSNRLIGDGNGLNTNQSGGMGEGWGDFNAMLATVKEGDDFAGTYSMGAYVGAASSGDAAYFGIRRVPYSTAMTRDPLTFAHIADGTAIAGAPCDFNCDGSSNSEVHNTGEVWATMLWECYAALLGDTVGMSPRLTFDQARARMRAYLVASLKLTPVNPTFTEARDAVLSAALASDPVDAQLFCDAFAKRGIGQGAVSPDRFSNTNSGVVESFACVLPPSCDAAPRGDCNAAPAGQVKFQGSATDPDRQKLTWKWLHGTAMIGDFGDPATSTTSYRLCVYDDDVLASGADIGAGGNCGSGPCWTLGSTGLTYKHSGGNAEGIAQMKIKPGTGRAQILVKGKGSGLALPFPITDSTRVTVQLVTDTNTGSQCWSSQFAAPAAANDPVGLKFQDKLP